MLFKAALAALATLLPGLVTSQACPEVQVRVYGDGDQSCGGGSEVVTLRNYTVLQYPNRFSSVHPGHATDQVWDNHCIIFTLVGGNSSQLTSGFQPYNGTGNFDPVCKNTTESGGKNGGSFFMICAIQGGPSDCGPNGGGGGDPPGSTSSPSTMPPTTTSEPASTSDMPTTLPPNTTPSPTDTSAPNTEVQDAISSASSAISVASSAAAALAADPTNPALAETAENEVYDALSYVQDANNLASDYSASEISSDLDNVDGFLVTAGVAGVAAAALLTAAAANEFLNAFNDVQDAAQAAAANAANPNLNPRPARPRPSSTRPTPGPCTISIERADANLAQPTPDPTDLPPGTGFTNPTRRDIHDMMSNIPDVLPPYIADALGLKYDPDEEPVNEVKRESYNSLEKRVSDRAARYCMTNFQVPNYNSYNSINTGGNTYKPIYGYYSDNDCADWDWSFRSAASYDALPKPPPTSDYPSRMYATEHVYEIQSVARFVEYARMNVPILQQMYPDAQSFCNGFFANFLAATNTFAGPGVYDYTVSPLQQVYNALEGGTGGATDEFVYLDLKVNGQKGNYFGLKTPGRGASYQDALASITRTAVLAEYLNTNNIVDIYRTVSDRIFTQFVQFGRACNDSSADPAYRPFGTIDWASTYDAWEQSYLALIEANIQVYVRANLLTANSQISAMLRLPDRELPREQKARLERMKVKIRYQQDRRLRAEDLSLARLRG